MRTSHPNAEGFKSKIDEVERVVEHLRLTTHRIWAANKCLEIMYGILRASPPPSVSLFNEIHEAIKLVERIKQSQRTENALTDRVIRILSKASRYRSYPPRVY